MSIFLARGANDGDLHRRVAELEDAHTALARELETLRAEMREDVELLTLLGVEAWLRDLIVRGKASGWRVECSPKEIVFTRAEGAEHTCRLPVPIPDNAADLRRIKDELHARIICFERRAA